jgi:hypothetical protein
MPVPRAYQIFKVSINPNDTYGTPENLGFPITESRETFPYISPDNKMYFASDGHPGLGGLGFVMDLSSKHPGSTIENLGTPYKQYPRRLFICDRCRE